jgi:phosphate transport system substrate-binding protein
MGQHINPGGKTKMKLRRKIAISLATIAAVTAAGAIPANAITLNGGGASFMANMMDICAAQFNRTTNYNPDKHVVSYASVGSGSGKTGYQAGTYKFGGSESAYSATAAKPADLVYVPLIAGPISIGYRLDGVLPADATVQLKSETVAKIFAGTITAWNDPAIVADNTVTTIKAVKKATKHGVVATIAKSGKKVNLKVTASAAALKRFKGKKVVITRTDAANKTTSVASAAITGTMTKSVAYSKGASYAVKVGAISLGSVTVDDTLIGQTLTMPNTPIRVVYRSGTSGTTNMFANYLNKTNPTIWNKVADDDFAKSAPAALPTNGTFQSASGNDGVANLVKDTNGGITYAELSFIEERADKGVKSAAVGNNAGNFVVPTTAATSAFYAEATVEANGLVTPDYTVKAADAYLINAISFGLSGTAVTTDNAVTKTFFSYFLSQCAPKSASGAGYAALSGAILTKALAQVAKINAG